jgi:hypothetical protein
MTTYIRLDQIRKANTFTDNLTQAQIATVETDAVDSEDFLGGMLSQINKVVGVSKWYSSIQASTGQPRNLKALTDDIYYKTILRRRSVLTFLWLWLPRAVLRLLLEPTSLIPRPLRLAMALRSVPSSLIVTRR